MGGIAKHLKTKVTVNFKSFEDICTKPTADLALDPNLAIADFEKIEHNAIIHVCFLALEAFKKTHGGLPKPWDLQDAEEFVEVCVEIAKESKFEEDSLKA